MSRSIVFRPVLNKKRKKLFKVVAFLWAIALLLGFSACSLNTPGDDQAKQRAKEDLAISSYLSQNGKSATRNDVGIYKVEVTAGTGPLALTTDVLELDMKLNTFEGQQFFTDTAFVVTVENNIYLPNIAGAIPGLANAALQLNKGETAEFYIPSYLFFGSSSGFFNGVTIGANETIVAILNLKDIRTSVGQRTYEDQVIASILKDSVGYVRESDGLYRKTRTAGTGVETPMSTSSVLVNFTGTYLDNTEFDSGVNTVFQPQNTVEGFGQALMSMHKGETAVFYIPSQLAYGPAGSVNSSTQVQDVGAYKTLRFEITIVNFTSM